MRFIRRIAGCYLDPEHDRYTEPRAFIVGSVTSLGFPFDEPWPPLMGAPRAFASELRPSVVGSSIAIDWKGQ